MRILRFYKLNIFDKARLRLTFLYAGITLFIITLFSVFLISSLEKNIHDMLEEEIRRPQLRMEIFKKNAQDLENTIFYIDTVLLFLVSWISFILAGQTLKPIRETLDIQRRFIADASHDLRTPLTIMKTEIEVGLAFSDTEKKNTLKDDRDYIDILKNNREYISILKSNLEEIDKMSALVSNLLLIARSEKDEEEKDFKIIQSKDFINKIVIKFESQIKSKKLNLTLKNNIDQKIKINTNTFERALQNIIQNAVNYTKEGGHIRVTTFSEEKYLTMEISDTGVGISSIDLPHIFDRFYKAEHSRNDSSGSGLGLSIAKQIIDNHGGVIKIESNVNAGTKVIINLPI